MKLRNLKQRIHYGWGGYFTVRIAYDKLGLKREDFVTTKDIFEYLDIIPTEYESRFVGHYNGIDFHNQKEYVIPSTNEKVILHGHLRYKINRSYSKPIHEPYFIKVGDVYYNIEYGAGYKNPEATYGNKEPWWLFNDTPDAYTRYHETNIEAYRGFLTKYEAPYEFEEKLWDLDEPIGSGLLNDLGYLMDYCKVTYFKPQGDHMEITYVLYGSGVKDFIRKLKKIIKLNKIKL